MHLAEEVRTFCVCVCAGFTAGVLYAPFCLGRALLGCPRGKNKIAGAVLDVAFFLACALWYLGACYLFRFPDFRVHTLLAFALGGIIYLKSLQRIVDFFIKVCYNKLEQRAKKRKNRKKARPIKDKK